MITRASSILILAGVLVMGISQFAAAQDPTPSPTPDPSATPLDKQYIWLNSGTDFNAKLNWTPNNGSNSPPVAGDVAAFAAPAPTPQVQPQLTASDTISGLYFTGTGSSGYDLTRSGTQTLTLTAMGTAIGSEIGDNTSVAIGAENTSGTNTIDVPLILAPSTLISYISQAAGGTLVINGAISGTGIAITKIGGGTLTLNGANTYSGGTNINAGTILIGISNVGTTTGALGPSTAAVNLGDTTGSNNASLLTNGAFTFSNNITVRSGSAGTATIGGNTANSSTFSGAIGLNKNLTVTAVSGGTVNLTGSITNASGTNTVNITGTGTSNVILNNPSTSNQFAPTTFSINSGKLSLGASNQIGNSTNVTVNGGGTLSSGGFSEGTRPSSSSVRDGVAGMGALTLQSTSSGSHAVIDFTSGTGSSLVFSSLSGAAGAFVNVLNWTGFAGGDNSASTNDRLLFATNPSLTPAQLANWQFFNDSGTAFATGGLEIPYGNMFEIVPIPEPGTWCAAGLAFLAVGYTQRRRLARLLAWA